MYSTAGMKRADRNVFGQSSADCAVNSLSRPERVSSSNAAAASAVNIVTIGSYGNIGISTGISATPISCSLASAASANRRSYFARSWNAARFLRCSSRFFFGILLRLWSALEIALQVSNPQFLPIQLRVPVERRVFHRAIFSIRPVNSAHHQRAILHRAADWPQFVHAPRQSHRASARHKTERGPQASATATRRGRRNRSQRLRTDAESHATRRRRRCRARRRSARTLLGIPRIARLAAKPYGPLCQRSQRQLRDQHRARFIQPLHHHSIFVDGLLPETRRAPRRAVSLHRQQVLRAPRQTMQRPAIFPRGNLPVCVASLHLRALLSKRHREFQQRVVSLEPPQIHFRKRAR